MVLYFYVICIVIYHVSCCIIVTMFINCVVYGRTLCKTALGWWVILVKYVLIKINWPMLWLGNIRQQVIIVSNLQPESCYDTNFNGHKDNLCHFQQWQSWHHGNSLVSLVLHWSWTSITYPLSDWTVFYIYIYIYVYAYFILFCS